jgi:uncharacterized protein involved in exopolysaccharide biosynthesis
MFIFYAFTQPDIYKSSALLKVNSDSSSTSSSILNNYQNIASLAGISMPSGRGVEQSELAIQIIKSRAFMNHLIAKYDIKKNILSPKKFDVELRKIIYSDININEKTDLDVHSIFVDEILKISKNKENFITISISHISPDFAFYLLDAVVKELNLTIKNKDLKNSSDAMNYLNQLLPDTKVQDIKKSINKLIEKQLEVMMLASIKSDYILEYVDPPFIPEKPNAPKRVLIILIGMVSSLVASFFVVFLSMYIRKLN